MNRTELAYLAGIIDGEGHIKLRFDYSTSKLRWEVALQVEMTSANIITWLKQTFGGTSGHCKRRQERTDTFRWQVSGRKAYDLAKLISPFIIGKREEIALFIEAYETTVLDKRVGRSIPKEIWELREIYANQLISIRTHQVQP